MDSFVLFVISFPLDSLFPYLALAYKVQLYSLLQTGLGCLLDKGQRIWLVHSSFDHRNNMYVADGRVVGMNSCCKGDTIFYPLFQFLHRSDGYFPQVQIPSSIFLLRVRANDKAKKDASLFCLVDHRVGFLPGYLSVVAKKHSPRVLAVLPWSVLDVSNFCLCYFRIPGVFC